MTLRFHDVQVVTPTGIWTKDLLVNDGTIVDLVEPDATTAEGLDWVDGKGAYAYPGMIDVLTHGYGPHLYTDAEESAIADSSRSLPRHGVTAFAPSVLSLSLEELENILRQLSSNLSAPGARVLGIHSEGPCLASAGAHKPEALLKPSADLAKRMLDAANGKLAFVTLAPELPGAEAFCSILRDAGVGLHLGHSCARPEQISSFLDYGITGVTHMYDVMVPAQITEPGAYPLSMADAILAEDRLCLGLICDGVHVQPTQVKLLTMMGPGRLFLETDSMKFTGYEPGRFELYEGMWVTTSYDNAARGEEGGLAGSCITSERALRKLIEYSGIGLSEASIATSLMPAALAGRAEELGSLETGKQADVVLLEPDSLEVVATYVAGREVYRAGQP